MWFWIIFIIVVVSILYLYVTDDFTPPKGLWATGNPNAHFIGCYNSTLYPHKYPTVNNFAGTKTLDECVAIAKERGDSVISMRDSLHYKKAQCWTGPHVNYTYENTRCTGQGNDNYGRNFGGTAQDAFYAVK